MWVRGSKCARMCVWLTVCDIGDTASVYVVTLTSCLWTFVSVHVCVSVCASGLLSLWGPDRLTTKVGWGSEDMFVGPHLNQINYGLAVGQKVPVRLELGLVLWLWIHPHCVFWLWSTPSCKYCEWLKSTLYCTTWPYCWFNCCCWEVLPRDAIT